MAEVYVVCEGCGQRLRNWRRYPFASLAQWMGLNNTATARAIHVSGTTEQEYLCHGITRKVLERIAAEHKFHPAEVWHEIIDHDIEDHSVECAADKCEERFVPSQRTQLYCSPRCRRRMKMRRHRATPHGRQQNAARSKRWREDCSNYVQRWGLEYRRANKDRIDAYNQSYYRENREAILEQLRKRREAAA